MNNTNKTVRERTGIGIKLLSLIITATLTLFAVARITNLFVSTSMPTRSYKKNIEERVKSWELPDEIFSECGNEHNRSAIAIDLFAKPEKQLSNAWNFSIQEGSKQHALLNTGWGTRKKSPATKEDAKVSAQGLIQSVPQGNFAYGQGTAFHPVSENKYPDFKNSPWQSGQGAQGQPSKSTTPNNGSYAGRTGGDSQAPTSQSGSGSGASPKSQANQNSSPQKEASPKTSPIQRSADTLISIIEKKMLSNNKQGKEIFSKSEFDRAFAQFEQLIVQSNKRTGSEQKDRMAQIQAKCATTDIINSFYRTLAGARKPNSVAHALTSAEQVKLHTRKASCWGSIKDMVRQLNTAPTDKQTNPYGQVCHVYDKFDKLLTTLNSNPKAPAAGQDTFKEVRELEEKENIEQFLKNKNLGAHTTWREWIEYLHDQIENTFGTPWFNKLAIEYTTKRIQDEIEKAIQEKQAAENATPGLEQLQNEIKIEFENQITRPLFQEKLGLDLNSHRAIFDTLTESSNASALQQIGTQLQQSGLNKTGAEQLEIIIKGFMGMWVSLSSGFSGQIGGMVKQLIHNITSFACSPTGKDVISLTAGTVGTAVGLKALTGIFSSTASSLLTLGTVGGLVYKVLDFNTNTPEAERAEKIQNFGKTIEGWISGATELAASLFGGGKKAE